MTINMEENTEDREVWIKNHMEKRKENNKQSQKTKTIGNGDEMRVVSHYLGIS